MSRKEMFSNLSLWMVNLNLKSYGTYFFCLKFILYRYLHVWIRIRIPNTDPEP